MITREQIEEIQAESREKGISIKNLLKGKGIPEGQYFWWKRKYSKPDVPEGFVPIAYHFVNMYFFGCLLRRSK